jgi:4-diphosphocytidyl-2-C-methyl-D-erythritol kinase
MERVIRRRASAKVNVFLRVLGRRADGYHEIESLIVPVSLADDITVRLDPELRLSVRGELADAVPLDEDNLVVRAARALASAGRVEAGADIELQKRIPVAAGLGGGSADAAAALLALDELWGCGLDGGALLELGASVGSDVPALLHGGPVIVRGRGEIVEPATVGPAWWVLVPMPFQVRVGDAFAWWDESGEPGPDFLPILKRAGGRLEEVGDAMFNVLEVGVAARHREVGDVLGRLRELGALGAVMCGSGPTVAGLAATEEDARQMARTIPGSISVSTP